MTDFNGTATEINPSVLLGAGAMDLLPFGGLDDGTYEIALPFPITFLGTVYNSVWLHSNGFLTFGAPADDAIYFDQAVGFNRLEFLAGDHWLLNSYTAILGSAPARTFTIRIESSSDYQVTTPADCECEITFYEDSGALVNNLIDVQYGITASASGPMFTGIKTAANDAVIGQWLYTPDTGQALEYVPIILTPEYSVITIAEGAPATSNIARDESFVNIDTGWVAAGLEFDFKIGANTYNAVYISTEGYVTFGSGYDISAGLTRFNPPADKIFLYGGDRQIANLYVGHYGDPPDRYFRIRTESRSIPFFPGAGSGLAYEVDFIDSSIVGAGALTLDASLAGLDDAFQAVALPFDVNFNGAIYDTIYVGTNGYLTFGSGSSVSSVSNISPGADKIFLYGGDRRGRNFYYGTFGTTPNRTFVVRVEHSRGTAVAATDCHVEVVFYENATGAVNEIRINYDDMPASFGGVDPATTGLYGANGYTYSATWNSPSDFTSVRLTPSAQWLAEQAWPEHDTIGEVILWQNSPANTGNQNIFDVKYGINNANTGLQGAYSSTGNLFATWANIANVTYRMIPNANNTPVPPPPPPPPPPIGPSGRPTGDPLPPEYFGRILNYDQVWKGNSNVQLAITTADVGYHNVSANSITVINIQNASNNELDFITFYLGETVYSADANVTFKFLDREFYIYLDTNLKNVANGYGFAPGSTITQHCSRVYVDVELTEGEYLELCGCTTCGHKNNDCNCDGGPIPAPNRTIPVLVSEAKTLTATVVRENTDPPFLVVANTDGVFCGSVITSGGITANVVGVLAPPLDRGPYLGPYIIERVAKYTDNYIDQCGNFVGLDNKGQYLGPHIGIDRHFTFRRSMDHDDMFIIVANWNDTGRNVPMGRIYDLWNNPANVYTSIGMAANIPANVAITQTARLLDINYENTTLSNENLNIHVKDTSQFNMNVSDSIHHHYKIHNRCHDVLFFGQTVDVNTTLYTKSYAEPYGLCTYVPVEAAYREYDQFANAANAIIFKTSLNGGEFNRGWIKPEINDPRPNNAYNVTVVVGSNFNHGNQYDWGSHGVLWPSTYNNNSGAPSGTYVEEFPLSFMHTGDSANLWFGFSNRAMGTSRSFLDWPWATANYEPVLRLDFAWYYYSPFFTWPRIDGLDLRPRVWIEIPGYSANFTNNVAGTGINDNIYIDEANNISAIYHTPTSFSNSYIDKFYIFLGDIIRAIPLNYKSNLYSGLVSSTIYNVDYNSTEVASSITGNSSMTYVGNYTGANTRVQLALPFTVNYGASNTNNVYVATEEALVYFNTLTSYTSNVSGYGQNVIKPLNNSNKYLNDLFYLDAGSYYVIRAECGDFNSPTDTVYELSIVDTGLDQSVTYEVQYETVPVLISPEGISANGTVSNLLSIGTSTVYWGANTAEGWQMVDNGNKTFEYAPSERGPYIDIHFGAYWQDPGSNVYSPTNKFETRIFSDTGLPINEISLGLFDAPTLNVSNSGPNYIKTMRCYLNYLDFVEV